MSTENELRELQDVTSALKDHSQILERKYAAIFSEKNALEQINIELRLVSYFSVCSMAAGLMINVGL